MQITINISKFNVFNTLLCIMLVISTLTFVDIRSHDTSHSIFIIDITESIDNNVYLSTQNKYLIIDLIEMKDSLYIIEINNDEYYFMRSDENYLFVISFYDIAPKNSYHDKHIEILIFEINDVTEFVSFFNVMIQRQFISELVLWEVFFMVIYPFSLIVLLLYVVFLIEKYTN